MLLALTLVRLCKPALVVATPLILAVTMKPTDLITVITISVICTLLAGTVFVNSYVNFESRFVQWFSHLTSSPRWFTVWFLIMILWIPLRKLLLEHGYISPDVDFVVATVLWSCGPYMVENLLKAATARSMALVTELILEIRASQDRAEEHDKALAALLNRILDAIEDKPKEVSDA